MRGNVFIGGSGNVDLAKKITVLLAKSGYNGILSGSLEETGTRGGGAAVIAQMRGCCAAIMLFASQPEVACECGGASSTKILSANMLFELGYLVGSLRIKRVFTVYLDDSEESAPSDLRGIWGVSVSSKGKTLDELASEIVELFLFEQREEIVENKMELATDISRLRGKIIEHTENPVYYESEIAQLILLYCQSSYMFGVMDKAEELFREILHSGRNHDESVILSINSSLCYFEICKKLESDGEGESATLSLPYRAYRGIRSKLLGYIEDVEKFADGAFKRMFLVVVYDYLTFANMMYYQGAGINEDLEFRETCVIRCGETCESLRELDPEKNDQIAALYEAYGYRNGALFYRSINKPELAREAFEKSKNARYKLLKFFRNKDMDKNLFEQIKMEYYLALTDDLSDVDETEKKKRMRELDDYVTEQHEAAFDRNFLVNRIERVINEEEKRKISSCSSDGGLVVPFGFSASGVDAVKALKKNGEEE